MVFYFSKNNHCRVVRESISTICKILTVIGYRRHANFTIFVWSLRTTFTIPIERHSRPYNKIALVMLNYRRSLMYRRPCAKYEISQLQSCITVTTYHSQNIWSFCTFMYRVLKYPTYSLINRLVPVTQIHISKY